MSAMGATSSQLCPIENFGVVPRLTSVTLSFSPGLATISVTLNFMVSLPVISIGRPSCTVVAGAAGDAADGEAAGVAGGRGGGGRRGTRDARERQSVSANGMKYRGIESFLLCSLDFRSSAVFVAAQ